VPPAPPGTSCLYYRPRLPPLLQRFGVCGFDSTWFGVASPRRVTRFERGRSLCDL